jgi:thioredoxin:protein disulfide reductase
VKRAALGLLFLALALTLSSGARPAFAAVPDPATLLKVDASVTPRSEAGRGTLVLKATLAPGWHVNSHKPSEDYLIPTTVTLAEPPGVRFGEPSFPEGKMEKFSFSEAPLSVYAHDFTIEVPLEWTGAAVPAVSGTVEFQACNDTQCLAPASVAFRTGAPGPEGAAATTAPAAADVPLAGGAVPLSEARRVQKDAPAAGAGGELQALLEKRGLLLVLLTVFLGGLALNLTPCVYPVIPLTVGFFSREARGSTSRAFGLSALYVLGMAATYSALGVAAALSGKLFGSLLQNPIVLTVIAGVLVLMALSMFGYWEIRMPSGLMNRAGARSGAAGAFGMGLFVGVVAAPCVGGFIVGLLAFVSVRQDPALGFLLFFVLSLGLGLPYLFLGAFSGSLSRLPRAGAWMESVKKVFGWILLAMAAYFLRSVLPRPAGLWLLPIVLVIGLVAVLVRGYGLRWPLRAGVAALFLAIAIFFIPRTVEGWQPYPGTGAVTAPGTATSTAAGRPAVIDFSAEWCLPCLELEKRTFSDPRVRKALDGRDLYKADMTKLGSPETVALAERFGILGVPTVIFLDASGQEQKDLRLVGFEDADAFLKRIERAR